jgi:adenylyl cyclase-associated protein
VHCAAATRGPPPPPPPPKPGAFFEDQPKATKSSAGSQAELLAALNQGSGITSGLKKVTADMKTKNRADRTGARLCQTCGSRMFSLELSLVP